jgi:hypothetical protein
MEKPRPIADIIRTRRNPQARHVLTAYIAVGDTLSVRVVNVTPDTAEAPDSNDDLERNAFEAAKAKYLELKPKYEP